MKLVLVPVFPGSKVRVAGLIGLVLLLISGIAHWLATLSLFDMYGLISNLWSTGLFGIPTLEAGPSLPSEVMVALISILVTLILYSMSIIAAASGAVSGNIKMNAVAGCLSL